MAKLSDRRRKKSLKRACNRFCVKRYTKLPVTAGDRYPAATNVSDLQPGRLISANRYFVHGTARRHLAAECSAECVDVCALCDLEVVFSTKVTNVAVSFAEWCLYLDAKCGW